MSQRGHARTMPRRTSLAPTANCSPGTQIARLRAGVRGQALSASRIGRGSAEPVHVFDQPLDGLWIAFTPVDPPKPSLKCHGVHLFAPDNWSDQTGNHVVVLVAGRAKGQKPLRVGCVNRSLDLGPRCFVQPRKLSIPTVHVVTVPAPVTLEVSELRPVPGV